MSASSWFIVSIVGFSFAGVALVAAVFMFLKLQIPSIIGDLTGKTAARGIQAVRETNAAGGAKSHRPSEFAGGRSTPAGESAKKSFNSSEAATAHSSKRLDQMDKVTAELHENNRETAVLSESRQTEVLTEERVTEVLTQSIDERASDGSRVETMHGTSVLNSERGTDELRTEAVSFRIIRSLVEIHTDEVIE